jgi:hypothetical protein
MSHQQRHQHTSLKVNATPPPPKTWRTPTYTLERYTVRRHVKVVGVHLHGKRGSETHTETISLPLLPHLTESEYIQAAVFFSPYRWSVPATMNRQQFNGTFALPLDGAILAALMQPSPATQTSLPSQPLSPDAPTVANTFTPSWQMQPPVSQPGPFQYSSAKGAGGYPVGTGNTIIQWFRGQQTKTKVGLGCGIVFALLMFFSCISAAFGSQAVVPAVTPTPTQQLAQAQQHVTASPTRAASPTRVPTRAASPTAKPTVRPQATPTTARPTPKPTQPPQPTTCPGINCNPWGYNFTPGNLIYTPPSNFCSYFPCISSFWEPDDPGDGYVVQCADSLYSQSGGERGACSYHGGVSRPLYAH